MTYRDALMPQSLKVAKPLGSTWSIKRWISDSPGRWQFVGVLYCLSFIAGGSFYRRSSMKNCSILADLSLGDDENILVRMDSHDINICFSIAFSWLGLLLICMVTIGCSRGDRQSSTGTESSSGVDVSSSTEATVHDKRKTMSLKESANRACQSDSDCVTTLSQGYCCLTYCEGFPVTRWEAERRAANIANCPPAQTCPPPAPCPPRDHVINAICVDGKCVAHKVPLDKLSAKRPWGIFFG